MGSAGPPDAHLPLPVGSCVVRAACVLALHTARGMQEQVGTQCRRRGLRTCPRPGTLPHWTLDSRSGPQIPVVWSERLPARRRLLRGRGATGRWYVGQGRVGYGLQAGGRWQATGGRPREAWRTTPVVHTYTVLCLPAMHTRVHTQCTVDRRRTKVSSEPGEGRLAQKLLEKWAGPWRGRIMWAAQCGLAPSHRSPLAGRQGLAALSVPVPVPAAQLGPHIPQLPPSSRRPTTAPAVQMPP
ncbi:hypothetical protein BDU57DRAFT_187040 [Ampelomyces quisqualis]|uniref:Uncharacterized protein n=1 Tax=Ampelomyces quisqualis TaxID=50730 RepID=A0A6A5QU32_AMPQU|nr:hypothetical protein BDU57DRAFT_187040 [Ampelomyces quisqualis]